jgi:hypothetical protein
MSAALPTQSGLVLPRPFRLRFLRRIHLEHVRTSLDGKGSRPRVVWPCANLASAMVSRRGQSRGSRSGDAPLAHGGVAGKACRRPINSHPPFRLAPLLLFAYSHLSCPPPISGPTGAFFSFVCLSLLWPLFCFKTATETVSFSCLIVPASCSTLALDSSAFLGQLRICLKP